jgi:arylsulfatase A-like enzyme
MIFLVLFRQTFALGIITSVLSLLLPVVVSGQPQETRVEGCNIILITTNVLRHNHLVPYGYTRNTTPAINEMAKASHIFDNTFAQAGYTLPNMMSMLTSLYPVSHGVLDAFKDNLPSRIYTLAEILSIHGYKTAWFADLNEPHLFLKIGFGRGYDVKTQLFNDLRSAKSVSDWVESNKEAPFFITINSRHTHSPYFPLSKYSAKFTAGHHGDLPQSHEAYLKMIYFDIVDQLERSDGLLYSIYDAKTKEKIKKMASPDASGIKFWSRTFDRIRLLTPDSKQYILSRVRMNTYTKRVKIDNAQNLAYIKAMYDGCLFGIDQEIIRPLFDTLKRHNIYEKSLIIFTADHGESLGEHGMVGHGLYYWDQLVHVPLIVKLPGSTQSARINALAQTIDIMPTIMDYLNIEIPHYAQGRSFLPQMLEGSTKPNYECVYGANREYAYLRDFKWKLIVSRTILNEVKIGERAALFNIQLDPEEDTNLAAKYPDITADLNNRLKQHLEGLPKYSDGKNVFPVDMDEKTRERIKKTGYW